MATTKISQLATLTTTDGAEELLINDGGTSKKVTIANVLPSNAITNAKMADDAIGIAELSATGTASSTTFLRGDNAWVTPTDTNTTYSAGTGITLTGTTFSASPVALTTVQTAANQTAHLALTAQEGDVVVRSDENKTYMHNGGSAGNMNDYTLLATPTDAVTSVGGNTGVVTNAQIAASVEAASDSNTFTDADHTKLNSVASSANNYTHPNHSGEVTSTADGATVIADNVVDEANLKVSNTPTNGYFLSAQSGNTGGMTWAEVDALPSQSSNSGKFLTTNGSAASWAVLDTDANSTSKGLYEHAHTIAANYSITSGNNAFTAGPITINSGISVTIPTGSTWIVA